MMPISLRTRPHAERRVLVLLRGGTLTRQPRPGRSNEVPVPSAAQLRRFADLRHAAKEAGLIILAPETVYIGIGELHLLSWLAEAQRVIGLHSAPASPQLITALNACAGLLDGLGIRLSPLTLYGPRLRNGAGALPWARPTQPIGLGHRSLDRKG